jgi:hypothetical protein
MFVSASAPDRPDPGHNTEEKLQLTDRLLWRDDSDRARDQSGTEGVCQLGHGENTFAPKLCPFLRS